MDKEKEIILLPTPQQLLELDKKGLNALAADTAAGIVSHGALSTLEVYIRARKLTEFATTLAKAVQASAEREARIEQPKGHFVKYGCKVTHTSGRSTWHYDNCGDPIYRRLLEQKKLLDGEIKDREKFLQAVPEEGIEVLDLDGELHSIRRAVKVEGAESITISY